MRMRTNIYTPVSSSSSTRNGKNRNFKTTKVRFAAISFFLLYLVRRTPFSENSALNREKQNIFHINAADSLQISHFFPFFSLTPPDFSVFSTLLLKVNIVNNEMRVHEYGRREWNEENSSSKTKGRRFINKTKANERISWISSSSSSTCFRSFSDVSRLLLDSVMNMMLMRLLSFVVFTAEHARLCEPVNKVTEWGGERKENLSKVAEFSTRNLRHQKL